jgi:hypothetical protein
MLSSYLRLSLPLRTSKTLMCLSRPTTAKVEASGLSESDTGRVLALSSSNRSVSSLLCGTRGRGGRVDEGEWWLSMGRLGRGRKSVPTS